MTKTRAQVREEFASKGWSISAWARDNRYSPNMVIAILADEQGHRRLFEGFLREYEAEGLA